MAGWMLKVIRSAHERHRAAAQTSAVQFHEHVPGEHQFAEHAILQAKRSIRNTDIGAFLRYVSMTRAGRKRSRGAAYIRAVPQVCKRLRNKLGGIEQSLSIDVKSSSQPLDDTNVRPHDVY